MRTTTTRSPWTVLVSTSLAIFAVFLDTTILFVAFPAIRADFSGVSASSLSWVLNAYTIVFAALLIPAGRLADRVGRRRTFLDGGRRFTLARCCAALPRRLDSSSPPVSCRRRCRCAGAVVARPRAADLPQREGSVAVAIWGAIGAVAGAAAHTGRAVVEHFDWRWAFFINLPVGIVSFALGRRVLPEGREANPGRLPDPLGVVLLAAGLALLAFAIVKTDEWGWLSTTFVGTVAVSAVLIAVFFWRCSRVSNPLLDLSLFDSQSFRWANPAMLIYASGFSAMFLGNVLFLTEVWHYSILRAGMAISIGPLIVAVTAPFFGRLAGRVGQRALVVPGGLVWASGGVLLLSRATTESSYLGVYLPALVLTALGVSLVLPQLSSAAVQGLPADRFGSGSAVNQAVRNLGATLGVALVVAFTADVTPATALASFHRVWWYLVGCGLVVTVLATRLPRRITAAKPAALVELAAA
jgi:EmrB/QacA subfamily drug resistance transporter